MKKLFLAYKNMISRCYSPTHQVFDRYGGRGIDVCEEWRLSRDAFVEWAVANGHADNLSLDRVDNNKGYSPENCRWITIKEQQSNRRSNRIIEYKGKSMTLTQWAEHLGIRWDTLKRRLDVYKMNLDEALCKGSKAKTWRHGTRTGYELHKCRCDECRANNNKRARDARVKKKHDLIGYAAIAAELG